MLELIIIKQLLNKVDYNKYISLIKIPEELKQHYLVLQETHDTVEGDLSLEDYLLHAEQAGCKYLDTLKDSEVGHESLSKLVKTLCERSWAHSAALLSVDVSEGRKPMSELLEHYDNYPEEKEEIVTEELFVTTNLHELEKSVSRETGLQWNMRSLNDSLGGLNKGNFGFIFARPETGKTTFFSSAVTHFATQVDRPVIWFNNEEQGAAVQTRLYQSSLGLTYDELFADKDENIKKYLTKTNNMLKLYDKGFIYKREVEALLKEVQPSLVIFDQLDKIKGFKAERDDLLLGSIYLWARELAKEYCPVIGVCQASASAENKKYLTMEDVAKSKTEKAAEADFIIGIGKTYDVGMEDIRYLHLIKNKLTGKHSKIECRIYPETGQYKDL